MKLLLTAALASAFVLTSASAADGTALANKLASSAEDGSSIARVRMRIAPEGAGYNDGTVYQLQVKARRTTGSSQVLYQLLWPRERKGEALLLKQSGQGGISGKQRTVEPERTTNVSSRDSSKTVMGSDLTYEDVITNFFRWKSQSIVGKETIGNAECTIIESKPGSSDSTSYGSVKSWIDTNKNIPVKIEKYSKSGKRILKIETDRVNADDRGVQVPSRLVANRTGSGTTTEVEGTKIRHDVSLSDSDFSESSMDKLK